MRCGTEDFDLFSGTVRMSSHSCKLAGACMFQSRPDSIS